MDHEQELEFNKLLEELIQLCEEGSSSAIGLSQMSYDAAVNLKLLELKKFMDQITQENAEETVSEANLLSKEQLPDL